MKNQRKEKPLRYLVSALWNILPFICSTWQCFHPQGSWWGQSQLTSHTIQAPISLVLQGNVRTWDLLSPAWKSFVWDSCSLDILFLYFLMVMCCLCDMFLQLQALLFLVSAWQSISERSSSTSLLGNTLHPALDHPHHQSTPLSPWRRRGERVRDAKKRIIVKEYCHHVAINILWEKQIQFTFDLKNNW